MKTKAHPKREGPVHVPLPFDEAIRRALRVNPPKGGWKAHDERLKRRREQRKKTT